WLFTCITLYVARGSTTVLCIPFVIVINARIICYWFIKIARVEPHGIVRIKRINWKPPIQLTHRGGIPRVTVRMKSVSNAGSQKIRRVSRAQSRNVKIYFFEVYAMLAHDLTYNCFTFGMMNKLRFHFCKDGGNVLCGHSLVHGARVVRKKGLLEHTTGEINQGSGAGSWGKDEDIASIQP